MTEVARARAYRREIGRAGDGEGPRLIVVGGVHGNEPSGVEALEHVFAEIERRGIAVRGRFVGLAGNVRALEAGERFLTEDFNRMWGFERVTRAQRRPEHRTPEALEQRELLQTLQGILADAGEPAYLVDLHTTSSRSTPFYILGDTLRNREFARRFPAPIVLGFEEHIRGTLMEYFTSLGHVAIAIEGGQHDAPEARRHHEAAVWLALVAVGCVAETDVPDLAAHRDALGAGRGRIPPVVEIFHRHRLTGDEAFRMDPGYENFHRVRRGQRLAEDRRGIVAAPADGLLFLPLYQKRGNDGFFLARGVNLPWLHFSTLLRRLGVPRVAPFLPGVRAHPQRKDTLLVNLDIARFFADRLFRLLGFRVERRILGRMVVRRRPGG